MKPLATRATTNLLLTTVILCTSGIAQDGKREKPKPESPTKRRASVNATHSYLPLAPGARWVWSFKVDDRAPVEMEWRCVRQVSLGPEPRRLQNVPKFWRDEHRLSDPEEEFCWEIRSIRGTEKAWEYWSTRNHGIYRFQNRFFAEMRGVSPKEPAQIIPGPIGISTQWKWTELGTPTVARGGRYPDDDRRRKHYTAKIESMGDKITVPAGTFDAIRIKFTMHSKLFGEAVETMWLARGTGIVKRIVVNTTLDERHEFELLRFEKGVEVKESIRAQIQRILHNEKTLVDLGDPNSIAPIIHDTLETKLGSEFFAARWGRRSAFFRHFEGKTRLFHPGSSAAWNRLIKDEIHDLSRTDGMSITNCFGVLLALYRSEIALPIPGDSEVNTRQNGRFDVIAEMKTNDRTGSQRPGWARMWFSEGKVIKLKADFQAHQVK